MNKKSIFEFIDVSKCYDTKKVFENFNFSLSLDNNSKSCECHDQSTNLKSANIIALLGANGAGKTTFIKMLLGLQTPNKGSVLIQGQNPALPTTRTHIGMAPQELDFPIGVKSIELLEFIRGHYKTALNIAEISEIFDLKNILSLAASKLSGGQKRRLALAMAFVGDPALVFLDEPTTGLDVIARKAFWKYIQNTHEKTIFLTTHDLNEIEKVAHRLLFLHDGQIVFDGTVAEFKKIYAVSMKKIKFYSAKISLDALKNCEFISSISVTENHYIIDTYDADDCVRSLVTHNIDFQNLHIETPSLEESFFTFHGANHDSRLSIF